MSNLVKKVYACHHINKDIQYNSTSGGFFLALCEYVIKKQGYVAGVQFDENNQSVHYIENSMEGCYKFSGSKYPQSNTNTIYKDVKQLLDEDNWVLFTGTPCQVAALKSVLGKEYHKLITVDLICMGVASPLMWGCYLQNEFGDEKIEYIRLKDKKYGWHKFSVDIRSKNKRIQEVGGLNTFMNAYVQGYIMRESCYDCKFKGDNRFSDMTIADCWGIENINPEFDDNNGVSVVFANSEKGLHVFDEVSGNLNAIEITFDEAVKANYYYHISKERPEDIEVFWKDFYKNKKRFFKKYDADSFIYRGKRKLKRIVKKIMVK